MEKNPENLYSNEWLDNLPVTTENPAFAADEMIACSKCQRSNPPTRLKCLYCGAQLEFSEAQVAHLKPILRKMEAWEKGFNLIYQPEEKTSNETNIKEIAGLTRLETDAVQNIIEAKKPLPLARAESEKEAEVVGKRLLELGVETFVIPDEALGIEKPPRRLRGIEFSEDKIILILFNEDEIREICQEDLNLIVSGAVFMKRVEATEKRNRKGENKILKTVEMASDEILIDIYSRADSIGFRIEQKGFDFSVLGAEKGILAAENTRKLIEKLREFAPRAKFVDDYLKIRAVLGSVWEIEQHTDSQGLKRERFGRFNLGNVTTVNNLAQFTKYSRLQWHLL
ncbi:MAG TPA: hypothetical protein VK892_12930 [Pyrinomonadaceae bacterium]|nr:hypothetical protein [Pyrinomonadaceae bacterium]